MLSSLVPGDRPGYDELFRHGYVYAGPLVRLEAISVPAVSASLVAGPRVNLGLAPSERHRSHTVDGTVSLGAESRGAIPLLVEARYRHGITSVQEDVSQFERSVELLEGLKLQLAPPVVVALLRRRSLAWRVVRPY